MLKANAWYTEKDLAVFKLMRKFLYYMSKDKQKCSTHKSGKLSVDITAELYTLRTTLYVFISGVWQLKCEEITPATLQNANKTETQPFYSNTSLFFYQMIIYNFGPVPILVWGILLFPILHSLFIIILPASVILISLPLLPSFSQFFNQ